MTSKASTKQVETEANLAAKENEGHELSDAELAGATGGAINDLNLAVSKSFLTRVTTPPKPTTPDVATPVADTSNTIQKAPQK